eukprot:g966.t1 g966   contig10:1090337-1090752(-)
MYFQLSGYRRYMRSTNDMDLLRALPITLNGSITYSCFNGRTSYLRRTFGICGDTCGHSRNDQVPNPSPTTNDGILTAQRIKCSMMQVFRMLSSTTLIIMNLIRLGILICG